MSNTDIFMQELLVGTTVSPAGSIASRGSTPSVETFPGSPESQVSPPQISDTQPAVLQPMTHSDAWFWKCHESWGPAKLTHTSH